MEVKICDFGLSRILDKSKTMTTNIGTVAWIAPEIFQKKHYSEKADVYSFGIILWELLTREMPYGPVESFSVPLLVLKGERPAIPRDTTKQWRGLIVKCWHHKPIRRPSFEEITRHLITMHSDMKVELARTSGTKTPDKPRELKTYINGKGRAFKFVSIQASHNEIDSFGSLSASNTTTDNGSSTSTSTVSPESKRLSDVIMENHFYIGDDHHGDLPTPRFRNKINNS